MEMLNEDTRKQIIRRNLKYNSLTPEETYIIVHKTVQYPKNKIFNISKEDYNFARRLFRHALYIKFNLVI